MRNTIMKTDEFIPLSEEVENLSHYFAIQKIRYGNSFDVCWQLAEETSTRLLPRFILQPLAENAVIHGTENMSEAIVITVSSSLDENGCMIVEVRDNGCGFSSLPVRREKESVFRDRREQRIRTPEHLLRHGRRIGNQQRKRKRHRLPHHHPPTRSKEAAKCSEFS